MAEQTISNNINPKPTNNESIEIAEKLKRKMTIKTLSVENIIKKFIIPPGN